MNALPLPAPDRTAPLALWRMAQAFLGVLYTLFGAPEDVAREDVLARKSHTLMASWLRVGEALLRRLLLIEAAACSAPNAPRKPRKPRRRARKEMSFWPDQPEKWRVSLRCFAAARERRAHVAVWHGAGRSARTPFRSAWPLAERYEALIRAFNDPAPFARRLAARLRAAPARVADLLRAPPEAEHRIEDYGALDAAARCRAPPGAFAAPNSS